MISRRRGALALLAVLLPACASLGSLAEVLQAPRFAAASDRPAALRLLAPSSDRPLGGVSVRLWAQVSNPNPVGMVLSSLSGTLALEGRQAAEVDFPLGLPLAASQDTVIPLDVLVSFADLPGLADVVSRAVGQGTVGYRLNGTVTVDAGLLGTPSFGPMALLEGSIQTRR